MNENDTLIISSPGIIDGVFDIRHTGYSINTSPAFYLKNLSINAKSLAITLEDKSHPIRGFTHWLIWNIPATDYIAAGIPSGKTVDRLSNAVQGIGYGFHRYAGPKPPRGKKHRYCFNIYALDQFLNLNPWTGKRKLMKEVRKHCIQRGALCASYKI